MENITKAIVAVMQKVKGIEKSATVGSGSYSYKGVPDHEVKKIIGEAMAQNGLAILPIKIQPTTKIERWVENGKTKQMVFTEVITEYMLMHISGESIKISGYGHGVDNQDKAAGKATTYALKYSLLYSFLTPTGKIDDTDNEHSDSKPVPQVAALNLNIDEDDDGNQASQKPKAITIEQATKELKEVQTVEQLRALWQKIPKADRDKINSKVALKRKELEGGIA